MTRPAVPSADHWRRAHKAKRLETFYRSLAENHARDRNETLPDTVADDYVAEVRRALLAVAGAHGVAAVAYRELAIDASRAEAEALADLHHARNLGGAA